jgi:hypothetical protein
VAITNPPRPDTRLADHECESVAEEEGDETSWLLAAALVEARRQGDPAPRDSVMGLLADMTLERGAGTVTLAALGLADVAAVLLEFCADSLKESPPTVLGDVLAFLRGHDREDGLGAQRQAGSHSVLPAVSGGEAPWVSSAPTAAHGRDRHPGCGVAVLQLPVRLL